MIPYKTIKIPLKTILRNHTEVQPLLNEIIFSMNDLVIHTLHFIRLYLLHLYHNNMDFPIIDETFIIYCLKTLGIRDNRGQKPKNDLLVQELNDFYTKEFQPISNHQKTNLKNTVFILPYLAIQILTTLTNNIEQRFIQYLLRFINKTTTEITDEKKILFQLKHQILSLDNKTDKIFDEWKLMYLDKILPLDIKKSVYYDVKVRPFEYLKGMLYMNSVLEEQENKLYQPIPLRNSIIPKYILLDTASIVNLFCPQDKKKSDLLKKIKDNQFDIWNSFLNLQHKTFRNKNYHFNYQLQTDGIGCSLSFIRKDLKDKKYKQKIPKIEDDDKKYEKVEDLSLEELELLKDKNVIGLDPGKANMVFMIDEKGSKLRYTAPQRRMEKKSKTNRYIMTRYKKIDKIIEKETDLSLQNSKTIKYEKFKEYIKEKDRLNSETSNFYKMELWRKMRFREYSYGKKSIDKFLNKIQDTFGNNIIIGYGNWSRSSQMKNFMPTMNKGLRKEIHRRYRTITINEYNTSKICCGCHNNLEKYKDKEGKEVFRLFKCLKCVSSQNKEITFRTRDVNSAINIRGITRSWIERQERPVVFRFKEPVFHPRKGEEGKKLDDMN